MQQSNGWRRMVAWALVGVLMIVLWATPGWARKAKEEKPKPIEGEIAGYPQVMHHFHQRYPTQIA